MLPTYFLERLHKFILLPAKYRSTEHKLTVMSFVSLPKALAQSYLTLCDSMDSNLQGSPSMEFSRQDYKSGLPILLPGDLPDQGSNRCLLHWQEDFLPIASPPM